MPTNALRYLAAGLCFAAALSAQENPAPTAPAGLPPTIYSRIRGLFDIDLPQLDPPGTFKLHFNPHLGDFVRRDYLRITTGFDWALTDSWQFSADADAYGRHGLRRGSSGYGIGQLHLGGKYLFQELFRPELETSVGLNIDLPTGRPPLDMTDGHNHYSPYLVVQHRLVDNPRVTLFANTALDFLTPSSVPGTFARNEPRDDSIALTGGAIYDLGQLKWTLQSTYQTTALIAGDPRHFFTVRPSVLWFVPREYTFHSKTQWILGVGVRATWGPDGTEFTTNSRLRAEVTFGQVVKNIRGVLENPRP